MKQQNYSTLEILGIALLVVFAFVLYSLSQTPPMPSAAEVMRPNEAPIYDARWLGAWTDHNGNEVMIVLNGEEYAADGVGYSLAFTPVQGMEFGHAIIVIDGNASSTVLQLLNGCIVEPNFDLVRLCR